MRALTSSIIAITGAVFVAGAASSPAKADLSNCQNIYVIRLAMYPSGIPQVIFGNSPSDTTGSNSQYMLSTLSQFALQQWYATLLTAKASKLPVTVATDGPSNCDLANQHSLLQIELRPVP